VDGHDLNSRAAIFAALGEPVRLALVDRLIAEDLSPGELAAAGGLGTNLLAHHLKVLEDAGIIRRTRSEGDRRRSYVQLRLDDATVRAVTQHSTASPRVGEAVRQVLFVCTANSARSQIAAATWNAVSRIPAASAGTHPAEQVHPQAVEVARRHGLRLDHAVPALIDDLLQGDQLVVAVCDNAHEELSPDLPRIHWSVPDPVRRGNPASFEDAYRQINDRVRDLALIQYRSRKAS
jgi:protein-tyrosine-phosphatase/DNA-binding HxlR family transcriptional regulator